MILSQIIARTTFFFASSCEKKAVKLHNIKSATDSRLKGFVLDATLSVMSQPPVISPEQRLPALHRMIDDLPAEELLIVEMVLARLEMDRLWKEVREGFDADWAAGRYEKIDEVIREARESLKSHAA